MRTPRALVVVLLVMIGVAAPGQDNTTTGQQPPPTETTPAEPARKPVEAAKPEAGGRQQKPPAPKPPKETKDPAPAPAVPNVSSDAAAAKEAAVAAERAAKDAASSAAATRTAVDNLTKNIAAESLRLRRFFGIPLLFLAILVLLSFPFLRRKWLQEKSQQSLTARRLNVSADKLEAALLLLDDKLAKASSTIAAKLAGANVVTPDQLDPIRSDVDQAREQIARVGQEVRAIASRPPSPSHGLDQVALERQVLGEWWKRFRANNDLSAAVDSAARESTWMPLIKQLAKVVPPDLKPTFDAAVAPCEDHWSLIQRIHLVPRVASGEAGDLSSPAEEVRRAREYASLLQGAQAGGDTASRLGFRFKNWVTDTFLPFADLYLQRYQQARLENRHRDLEPGVSLVRQLLRIAAVEPIEVTPGETAFDSTRHIGRSTTNDHRFADGVITGVVRNGFIEGGQLIRQPEVIVNRTR